MSNKNKYSADSIKSLDWKEHIRLRPGMYIGKLGNGSSVDDGIYILIKEIIDNSIDEFIMGFGKRINVELNDNEKVIIKSIKDLKLENIDICIINTKYPVWSIFSKINFDIILLETQKNVEQMDGILKQNGYILFDNLYFNRDYLIKGKN